MKNQKGSSAAWVITILIILIIVGLAYWHWMKNSAQPAASIQVSQRQTSVNAPTNPTSVSATIDQSTLVAHSSTPTISGTITNASSLCVVLLNIKAGNLPVSYNHHSNSNYLAACADSTTPEGRGPLVTLANGHWSLDTRVVRGLTFGNGSYNVGVYDGITSQQLTKGILVVSGVSE